MVNKERKVTMENGTKVTGEEGGDSGIGPIQTEDRALGASETASPEMAPEAVEAAAEAQKEQKRQQLVQAMNFYNEALSAVRGGLEVIETAWISAKLARKVGPALRYFKMVETQTKGELKRLENEFNALNVVQSGPIKNEEKAQK